MAARAQARPERLKKLKLAEKFQQNPGIEFLRAWWDDDPVLRIVIRKLLIKYPEWGDLVPG
ncbi:hypothetical protein JYQ62_19400 [Nostoc sp. UHCC 0702]|nr:hypothetical protein JYQ62_19400 [Nostoc sp. UHCC 0702]